MAGSGFENILVDISLVNIVPSLPFLIWGVPLTDFAALWDYRFLPNSLDYTDLCQKSDISAFQHTI